MHTVFDQLLDLLFPPRCVGCRGRGAIFCACCCAACQLLSPATNQALHRRLTDTALSSSTGVYRFDGAMRAAIHALKYEGRTRAALPLGDLLATYMIAHPLPVDVIVPVPLHADRLKERGFNQAALLSERLARRLDLPISTQLVRLHATEQQVGLDFMKRQANVRDAFAWHGTPPAARVLLVDDVLTTGATLVAAAEALRAAGAADVHGLALARAGVRC